MISRPYQTPILYLIVGVVASLSLSACHFGTGDETINVEPFSVVIPIDESNFDVLAGLTLVFSEGLTDFETELTFPSGSDFEISAGGYTASGSFAIGSCVFTFDESTFPAGEGPQDGDVHEVEDCMINLNTSTTTETGISQPGTLRLFLDWWSNHINVPVMVRNAGSGNLRVIANNHVIAIARLNSDGEIVEVTTPGGGTGSTGTGGTGTGGGGGGG